MATKKLTEKQLYKAKVEEMLKEYQVDKDGLEEEINKRRNTY